MEQTKLQRWKLLGTLVVAMLPAAANPWVYPADPLRPAAWAAMLTLTALVLVGRLSSGLLFGLVTAVLVGIHPRFHEGAGSDSLQRLAQALLFAALALNLAACHQASAERFCWWKWLLLLAGLIGVGGPAWATDRLAGVQIGVSVLLTMLASPLGVSRERVRPSRWNIVAAMALGVLGPVGAVALAWVIHRPSSGELVDLLPAWQAPDWEALSTFWSQGISDAFLVPWWVAAPVLAWACWRTLRRAWLTRKKGGIPVTSLIGWYSLLAGVATLFTPATTLSFQHLLPWCILLLVFLVFDLGQGIGERLVLKPPEGDAPTGPLRGPR